MNQTKRRIEITVEKHRLVVLSRRQQSINAWCEACGDRVDMVTTDEAGQLSQVSTRTIYRRIETGRLHLTEAESGLSLICLQSLEGESISTPGVREAAATSPRVGFFQKRLMKRILKRK